MVNAQSLSLTDPPSLGRYELLGRLGQGSQGIVFLARDPANGTEVAVKLLWAHLDGDDAARSRFLREVETAKRVARFCTAQVLDANVAGSQPYIVSEYIPGPSLAEAIGTDGPRTGGALDRIAINTATALGAIHQAGVVHRDFKAANVLLGPDGPVVIDFGVAKALGTIDRRATLTGQQVGTPAYMAPEQFEDHPAGPPADIFAWGATMVYAATGALPFGDGSIPSVMHRILNEAPDLGVLHGPMRDLVAACLAKDPAARPTARQIVDQLMTAGNVPDPTAAEAMAPARPAGNAPASAPPAGNLPPGAGAAVWMTDPLHKVRMRRGSTSSVVTSAPVLPADHAGPPEKPRIPRAAIIAAAVVIVAAGGIFAGLQAFTSSGTHRTTAGAVTGGTPTAPVGAKSTPARTGTNSSGVATVSGAHGPTTTARYNGLAGLGAGNLAPSGKTAGIPYFEPVKGDWDSLDGVRHCQVIGKDRTTEGIVCLGLLEGNSGGGTTWYTPALTAYCQSISTGDDVRCTKISGDFGMYSATGVQEAPREHGVCGASRRDLCVSGRNLFVDQDGYSWMTVSPAAARSCQDKGGEGTDCEIYPYAYAGLDIVLPGTHKNLILSASYKGLDAIGY